MLVLPFDQVVPVERKDSRLLECRFWLESGELPGILLWALEGLRRLRKRGQFSEPAECRVLREQYKRDSNPAAVFLYDCCEAGPQAATVSSTKLYKAYSAWVTELGHKPLSETLFAREVRRAYPLAEKGQNPVKMPDGTRARLWFGLRYIREDPR
jgi:phage/plasmid-associated DNA primase